MTDSTSTAAAAVRILPAQAEDLPAILALQHDAYRSEAALLGRDDIPPLRETLADVDRQFREGLMLKAVDAAGVIVGSVRGRRREERVLVGKLMVRPGWQGRGIGTRLLQALESRYPGCRFELFTSSRSVRNIALYERQGYRKIREEQAEPGLVLVFMEKRA